MRAILDVSLLLALSDDRHGAYGRAEVWWFANQAFGWASCPLTQNGFLRIASQRCYERPRPLRECIAMLQERTSQPEHEFWPDDLSLLDDACIDHGRVLSHRHLTDIYLLALAVRHGGRLVTLDRGVPLSAVRGASEASLVVV